jgi:uncharacterized membrane protein HdeD (DUF308 family)
MRVLLTVLGVLLIVFGVIWILQGIDVLPGSFMTGDIHWAIYGAIAVVVGIILIAAARRKKRQTPGPGAPPSGPTAP